MLTPGSCEPQGTQAYVTRMPSFRGTPGCTQHLTASQRAPVWSKEPLPGLDSTLDPSMGPFALS